MQYLEKSNSIGHIAALAVLWFINILIVVFAMPFLIYKTIRGLFSKSSKNPPSQIKTQEKPSRYFPCRMDS